MMELSLLTYCPVKGWLQPRRLLMNSCLLTNMAIFRIVQLNNAVYFNLYMAFGRNLWALSMTKEPLHIQQPILSFGLLCAGCF